MNIEETKSILKIIKLNYPQSFSKMTADESQAYLNLWTAAFAKTPLKSVQVSLWHYITDTNDRFAPNIGAINDFIKRTPDYKINDLAKIYFPTEYKQISEPAEPTEQQLAEFTRLKLELKNK